MFPSCLWVSQWIFHSSLYHSNLPRVLPVLLCRAALGFDVGGGISLQDVSAFSSGPEVLVGKPWRFSLRSAPAQPWVLLISVSGCPLCLWGCSLSSFPVQLLLPLLLPIASRAQGLHLGEISARQQCWFQFCQQLCANEGWFIKGEAEQPAWSRSRVFLEDGELCAGFFSSLLSV